MFKLDDPGLKRADPGEKRADQNLAPGLGSVSGNAAELRGVEFSDDMVVMFGDHGD